MHTLQFLCISPQISWSVVFLTDWIIGPHQTCADFARRNSLIYSLQAYLDGPSVNRSPLLPVVPHQILCQSQPCHLLLPAPAPPWLSHLLGSGQVHHITLPLSVWNGWSVEGEQMGWGILQSPRLGCNDKYATCYSKLQAKPVLFKDRVKVTDTKPYQFCLNVGSLWQLQLTPVLSK